MRVHRVAHNYYSVNFAISLCIVGLDAYIMDGDVAELIVPRAEFTGHKCGLYRCALRHNIIWIYNLTQSGIAKVIRQQFSNLWYACRTAH